MIYYDEQGRARGEIRIICEGEPLEGPYLPPPSLLAELGRYLAGKYSDKAIDSPRSCESDKEAALWTT